MRWTFRHPTDSRLRCEYGTDQSGLFVEVYLGGDEKPTVRHAADEEEGWDQRHPLFWQAVDFLSALGFVAIAEVHDAMDRIERGVPTARMPKRLRAVAELVECLQEAACAAS